MRHRFLIAAPAHDIHAKLVAEKLVDSGKAVDVVDFGNFPERSFIDQNISDESDTVALRELGVVIDDATVDVVWWRAYYGFQPSLQSVHHDDLEMVARENQVYSRYFPYHVARRALWINSPQAELESCNKLLQLRIARDCGMSVPTTVVTNDSAVARRFVEDAERAGKRTIYKSLIPPETRFFESLPAGAMGGLTTFVDEGSIVDQDIFKKSPGIFQHVVDSQYELRIFVIGAAFVAIAHNFRDLPDWKIDSRIVLGRNRHTKYHPIPQHFKSRCMEFMTRMGLSMGSFDVMVYRTGRYVFLEVNPQGAWLWMEDVCDEIRILDPFCSFLCGNEVSDRSFIRA